MLPCPNSLKLDDAQIFSEDDFLSLLNIEETLSKNSDELYELIQDDKYKKESVERIKKLLKDDINVNVKTDSAVDLKIDIDIGFGPGNISFKSQQNTRDAGQVADTQYHIYTVADALQAPNEVCSHIGNIPNIVCSDTGNIPNILRRDNGNIPNIVCSDTGNIVYKQLVSTTLCGNINKTNSCGTRICSSSSNNNNNSGIVPVTDAYMEKEKTDTMQNGRPQTVLRTCINENTREMLVEMCGHVYPIDMPDLDITDKTDSATLNEPSSKHAEIEYHAMYTISQQSPVTTATQSELPEVTRSGNIPNVSTRQMEAYSPDSGTAASPKSFLDLDNHLITSRQECAVVNGFNTQTKTAATHFRFIKQEFEDRASCHYTTYPSVSTLGNEHAIDHEMHEIKTEYFENFDVSTAHIDNNPEHHQQMDSIHEAHTDYNMNEIVSVKQEQAFGSAYQTKRCFCSGGNVSDMSVADWPSPYSSEQLHLHQDPTLTTTTAGPIMQQLCHQNPHSNSQQGEDSRYYSPPHSALSSASPLSTGLSSPTSSVSENTLQMDDIMCYRKYYENETAQEDTSTVFPDFGKLCDTSLQKENDVSRTTHLKRNECTYNDSFNVCSTVTDSNSVAAPSSTAAKKTKRGCRLWEFIRNLLMDPLTNPSVIRWEDRSVGTFRLVKSKSIARIWGMKKGNDAMNYEKLSRAMRYYYKRQVFQPVIGKRLVYQFGPRATGWKEQ